MKASAMTPYRERTTPQHTSSSIKARARAGWSRQGDLHARVVRTMRDEVDEGGPGGAAAAAEEEGEEAEAEAEEEGGLRCERR